MGCPKCIWWCVGVHPVKTQGYLQVPLYCSTLLVCNFIEKFMEIHLSSSASLFTRVSNIFNTVLAGLIWNHIMTTCKSLPEHQFDLLVLVKVWYSQNYIHDFREGLRVDQRKLHRKLRVWLQIRPLNGKIRDRYSSNHELTGKDLIKSKHSLIDHRLRGLYKVLPTAWCMRSQIALACGFFEVVGFDFDAVAAQ